jgi:hypothetical protein
MTQPVLPNDQADTPWRSVLLAVICFYFGVDAVWSVAIGVVVAGIGLAYLALPQHFTTTWPAAASTDRAGARSDIVALSWSLRTRSGRVGLLAISRLQQLASQRLAMRQLNLRDPRDRPEIERLLGRGPYLLLSRTDNKRALLRSYLRCLDAVAALERSDSVIPLPAELTRSRRLTSIFTLRRSARAR